jgi:hypothetical protein
MSTTQQDDLLVRFLCGFPSMDQVGIVVLEVVLMFQRRPSIVSWWRRFECSGWDRHHRSSVVDVSCKIWSERMHVVV